MELTEGRYGELKTQGHLLSSRLASGPRQSAWAQKALLRICSRGLCSGIRTLAVSGVRHITIPWCQQSQNQNQGSRCTLEMAQQLPRDRPNESPSVVRGNDVVWDTDVRFHGAQSQWLGTSYGRPLPLPTQLPGLFYTNLRFCFFQIMFL